MHHLFYLGFLSQTSVARFVDTLLLSQQNESSGPNLLTSLGRFAPLEFARATNGYVYMVDGLHAMTKWNGIRREVIVVGVAAPTTAPTLAITGSGNNSGIYQSFVRFYDDEGNVSDLSPLSNSVTASDNSTFTYTNVPIPTDAKVIGRQVLRNVSGGFLVFFVDVDTTDLTLTTLTSTRQDPDLRQQAPVPLFDEGFTTDLANRNGVPPTDKPIVTYYQNRLFAYGESVYSEGNAQVTFGSKDVTGIGTKWTTEMGLRYLYVKRDRKAYLIASVDKRAQTLVLDTEYQGATDLFAEYKIRPDPTRRHILAYSEAGRFDAWPETQTLIVASSDDIDDDPTGLNSTQSFLYILQRRHIYRMTFLDDPNIDGGIFLAARRGVINNRSFVNVDGFMYALDDRGIYKFDGSDKTEDISQPIQDLFYFDRDLGEKRINWRASKFFHAAHDRHDATIRWFVALSGDYLPRHAICYNYSSPQWWIEDAPFTCGDSSVLKDEGSLPIVAGPRKTVLAEQVGALDIVDAAQGDTRGIAASATRNTLTAPTTMTLPPSGVVGAPIAIVDGRGKGQLRLVVDKTGHVLTVDRPWMVQPDSTSEFQVGAIPWRWKSGWSEWPAKEHNQPRKFAVSFKPSREPNQMDMRLFQDYSTEPNVAKLTWPRNESESIGIRTQSGSADAEINLQQARGYAALTVDAFGMFNDDAADVFSVELGGFSSASPVVVYQIIVFGAPSK